MARKLQVQRTMTVCVATVMCYNTQDGTTCDREYITPKDYPNEHKLLKACQAYIDRKDESNPLKPVHLKHKHYEKRSYSMPLEVYIDTADITSKEEVLKKKRSKKQ